MITLRTLIQLVLILAFATAPLLQAAPVGTPVDADHAPVSHAGHEHHDHHAGHELPAADEHAASHANHGDCHGGEGAGGSCSSCVGCGIPMSSSSFLHPPTSHHVVEVWQWFEVDPESEQRPPKRIFS